MKTLGFIGTGGMGSGMAGNLIKAGYTLVLKLLDDAHAGRPKNQYNRFTERARRMHRARVQKHYIALFVFARLIRNFTLEHEIELAADMLVL